MLSFIYAPSMYVHTSYTFGILESLGGEKKKILCFKA